MEKSDLHLSFPAGSAMVLGASSLQDIRKSTKSEAKAIPVVRPVSTRSSSLHSQIRRAQPKQLQGLALAQQHTVSPAYIGPASFYRGGLARLDKVSDSMRYRLRRGLSDQLHQLMKILLSPKLIFARTTRPVEARHRHLRRICGLDFKVS